MAAQRDDLLVEFQRATREVLGEDAPDLTEDFELGEGDIDSLDLVEIMMVIEERLEVQFEASDFDDVKTVKGAIDVIVSKLGA